MKSTVEAAKLGSSRVWGQSGFDGQRVGPDHRLADGDVIVLDT